MALYSGDRLTTDKDGRVALELADAARFNLGGSTALELRIASSTAGAFDPTVQLNLSTGIFRFTAAAVSGQQRRGLAIGVGDSIQATGLDAEIWGRADAERDLLGLIQGTVNVSVKGGAPVPLDQAGSMVQVARGASTQSTTPVTSELMNWWLVQTEFNPRAPALIADGAWSVNLLSSVKLEAVQDTACRVQDRGYPVEIVMVPIAERTWHRLQLRGIETKAGAQGFLKAAAGMKFEKSEIQPPAESAKAREREIACARTLIANEVFISSVPTLVASVPTSAPASHSIPPTAKRASDPHSGERITVRRFVVEGAGQHPQHDVTPEAIQAIADQALARHADGAAEAHMTVGEMQQVADEITRHYRNNGFFVAYVFVPAQDITEVDATVKIQVLEGRVSEIVVEGSTPQTEARLRQPTQSLIGQTPIRENVEQAVLYAQDYPGVRLFGTFRAGSSIGDTQLVLKVLEEEQFSYSLGGDNYGTEQTGVYRARGDAFWNSPTGAGDRLGLSVLQAFNPENTTFGSLDYRLPLQPRGLDLALGASHNAFRVNQQGFSALDLEGTTSSYRAGFNWGFVHTRLFNAHAALDYSRKESKLEGASSLVVSNDNINVVSFSLGMDKVNTVSSSVDQAGFQIRQGVGGEIGTRPGADANYTIYDLQLSRLQQLAETQSVLLRGRYQYTSDILSALEQIMLTGPEAVRAYPVGDALRDTGRFASLEYRVRAPGFSQVPGPFGLLWRDLLEVRFFGDYAYGQLAQPAPGSGSKAELELRGAGMGIQFGVPRKFQALLQAAAPLSSYDASDGSNTRLYGEFSIRF